MKKIKLITIILLLSIILPTLKANTADTIPTKKTSTFENVASWYMDNMNYGTITLFMTVESTFIPFPSEIIVPPAAFKASQEGSDLNIVLVVIFATLGALCGAMINYHLALWLGRPIVHKFAESKVGKMCLLSSAKVQKAEDYFVKHGKSSTFIGRLVPGIRHLISIPAGLAKMKLLPFTIFTVLGAGIWNIILALMGYIAQNNTDTINKYSSELSYILLGLGVLFIIYLVYSNFIKKKKVKNQKLNNED
ncbi:MAG: DedA family protein [Bacteroidetes bacterium]|nr:DedA family protein [Bacteroidota bacterium]